MGVQMRWLIVPGTCLGLVMGLGACGDSQELNSTAGRTGPVPDGGTSSCVEEYSPAAIAKRAFAFDGIVVDIGPGISDHGDDSDLGLPGVTFEVRTWFSGGSGSTVTVDMQAVGEESTEAGGAYGIGSQLLVSGEPRWGGSALTDPIAWGCGFTRYYDPATARFWNEAL